MIKRTLTIYKNKRRDFLIKKKKSILLPIPDKKKKKIRQNKLVYAPDIFDIALNY